MEKIINTYSFMTVKRILEIYGIDISQDDFYLWSQKKDTLLHKVLQIPLILVMVSVIYEQAKDFQAMSTKMLLEYLTSDAANKSEDSPGASIRYDLEDLRKNMVEDSENFHRFDVEYKNFISVVQKSIISFANVITSEIDKKSNNIYKKLELSSAQEAKKIFDTSLCLLSFSVAENEQFWELINLRFKKKIETNTQNDLITGMQDLFDKFEEKKDLFASYKKKSIHYYNESLDFRRKFLDYLQNTHKLLVALPDYFFDADDVNKKLEELDFDKNIGVEVV